MENGEKKSARPKTIAEQLGDLKQALPMSYIAEHYFGKSSSWLSQRVNGTPVRGRVYTLNSEQKEIFNRALREIGEMIKSYRLP